MEKMKRPIWRVPLVLAGTGIACRMFTYLTGFVWAKIQMAQGPDPVTGAYTITSGYVTELMAAVSFLLFWAAGWRFL